MRKFLVTTFIYSVGEYIIITNIFNDDFELLKEIQKELKENSNENAHVLDLGYDVQNYGLVVK